MKDDTVFRLMMNFSDIELTARDFFEVASQLVREY